MVAEYDDRVVGFMIYELQKTRIHVLNFAVVGEFQRRGVGSQMIAKLTAKLSLQRRNRILLSVRETNLPAQLFFRENGFRAVSVLRSYYADTPEDAYMMQFRYRPERQLVAEPGDRAGDWQASGYSLRPAYPLHGSAYGAVERPTTRRRKPRRSPARVTVNRVRCHNQDAPAAPPLAAEHSRQRSASPFVGSLVQVLK